jgi:hypothetical protein
MDQRWRRVNARDLSGSENPMLCVPDLNRTRTLLAPSCRPRSDWRVRAASTASRARFMSPLVESTAAVLRKEKVASMSQTRLWSVNAALVVREKGDDRR